MEKRYLREGEPIVVEGLDFWNRKSRLTIEPMTPGDDRWMMQSRRWGSFEITPHLFRATGRYVYLELSGDKSFCEFEHVGFLYALGLRGVRVRLEGSLHPPFLCSQELYRQFREKSYVSGELKPYAYPGDEMVEARTRKRWEARILNRRLDYIPTDNAHMYIAVLLSYEGSYFNQKNDIVIPDSANLEAIVAAPTLGRPAILRPISKIVSVVPLVRGRRWLHGSKITWIRGGLRESEHSLLDKLLLSWAAPVHSFMTGEFISNASSHRMDVEMLHLLTQAA